jgi:hypothetical protein
LFARCLPSQKSPFRRKGERRKLAYVYWPKEVSLNFARCNQTVDWLRTLDSLRQAA